VYFLVEGYGCPGSKLHGLWRVMDVLAKGFVDVLAKGFVDVLAKGFGCPG
jgi:hypothetical protein